MWQALGLHWKSVHAEQVEKAQARDRFPLEVTAVRQINMDLQDLIVVFDEGRLNAGRCDCLHHTLR